MAIDQLGQEYVNQVAERTQDEFTRKLGNLLAGDYVLESAPDPWEQPNEWC